MTRIPIPTLLTQALEHHRAGRLQQAEGLYRQVLQQQPDQPDALQLLGIVALQVGQVQPALDLIGRAAKLAPSGPVFNNLGEAYRRLNRLDEAIAAFRRSLELQPQQIDAYRNMALAFEQQGKHEEVAKALDRAAELSPGSIDLLGAAGSAWARAGDGFRAASAFRKVLAIDANHAVAMANLALALASTGAIEQAMIEARKAVQLAPNAALVHGALAVVCDKAGRDEEAIAAFARAAELNPKHPDYYGHRGTILDRLERFDEAIDVYQQGCRACPGDARLFNNLSNLLRRQRRYADSVENAEAALRLHPGYSDAHGNRGLSLLALGDYENGFVEYEWRWRCDNFTTTPRDFKRPMWDGSDPSGRTILVHTEQGYGDTLQFARYIPMLAERGATVIVECHHLLRTLIATVRGVTRVVANGLALPDFDLHTPLLSLPRVFNTTIDTVPRDVPYIHPESNRVEAWKSRIRGDGLKVGLIWAGNKNPDAKRTVPGAMLGALEGIAGVSFFSLQKPDAATMQPAPPGLRMSDLSGDLADFHETAAAMMSLDLILTIDTAAAHLAGALGRPTWTLLPWSPDWRWQLDRPDSPWYPTMRLFRQSKPNDWSDALQRVREELTRWRA